MKKFLLKFIFFILLVIIIDKVIFYVFSNLFPKITYDKRLEKIISKNLDAEILILGSSRAARDISAEEIEKNTGKKTFNLGYPGSNIDFHLFLLQQIISKGITPQKIVLAIDEPSELINNKSINFRLDKLYPLVKYPEIKYVVDSIENQKLNYTSFFDSYRLKKCFPDIIKDIFKISRVDSISKNGSMLLSFRSITYDTMVYRKSNSYQIQKEDSVLLQKFETFTRLCEVNNIDLIIVNPPNYYSHCQGFKERIKSLTTKNKYIEFDSVKYMQKKYFYDGSHLNQNGAEEFTRDLIENLSRLGYKE